ncbi:MAG: PHP domain-containing protein [Gemmatimonadales bacterium]
MSEVDLHLHSTASDGECPPEEVVARAARAGLSAVALTDHDTLDGVAAAIAAGSRLTVRVIGGCEFSVAAPWGEMHVLGYFLSPDSTPLQEFLAARRTDRERRGRLMVDRLRGLGVTIDVEDLLEEAGRGAIGRPHVARALVKRGAATSVNDAFDRFIGRGKHAFVEKVLPTFREVADLVHRVGGVVAAAHLKERGTRSVLRRLKEEGLDAVETRHPSHDPDLRARLTDHALALGLLRTGGSDWHGDPALGETHAPIGSQQVPGEWLDRLEASRPSSAPALS